MKRCFIPVSAALLSLSLAAAVPSAHAALKQGGEAPDFTLPATQNGQETSFTLHDALKNGPVVLYFYPAAFTKGCTAEAHGFADAMPQFKALGASVIGVSMDNIHKLDDFSVSQIKGQFPVASDTDGKVTRLYDAKMPMLDIAQRITYVIAPEGQIIDTISTDSPGNHVSKALAALKSFKADTMKNRRK
ncbi:MULTISPECIES: peroxiredoxin [Asaia]|uniref:thioredoxin-dependent peroxiredoxin n=1 Tax=Asaia bogorensis TaxID=91915 RepID=A0A060QIT8_9PROT|nr:MULTISPECIES: peroxiredoxin [Asaia]ETC97149.1 Bcp [Asaia sp. SF2.1]MDL2170485.1 peroxiredoxin [Asaia sp. HumB]CDG41089.1 Alkyl hydroperoxide reductase subunit C-like protein [Asaia bogorensis]